MNWDLNLEGDFERKVLNRDLNLEGDFERKFLNWDLNQEGDFERKVLNWDLNLDKVGEISQTGRQRIPDRWSDETERVLTERFQITFRNFLKLLSRGSEGT